MASKMFQEVCQQRQRGFCFERSTKILIPFQVIFQTKFQHLTNYSRSRLMWSLWARLKVTTKLTGRLKCDHIRWLIILTNDYIKYSSFLKILNNHFKQRCPILSPIATGGNRNIYNGANHNLFIFIL